MWVVLVWQNLPYEFKNSYSDLQNRNFEKSHRTKFTSTCWSPVRSETGYVILGKFWSRYDLQNFRKRKFLGDDQGELSKGTVQLYHHVAYLGNTCDWLPCH